MALMDEVWLKAQIHIYRLSERIPRAPIFLSTQHGGLGSPAAVEYLMKELAIHIAQCTQREDELCSLILQATKEELAQAGHTTMDQAFRSTRERHDLVESHTNRS